MKKINIKKTALALMVAGTMALCRSSGEGTNSIKFNKGDYVKPKVDLNVRIDDDIKSKKVDLINQGEIIYRVLSLENGWDLIKYNDKFGYVAREYLEDVNTFIPQEVHYHQNDIIRTNSKVNFRIEPSLDGKRIGSIKKGELADVIAKTENNWYLIYYGGTIGYVSGEYVTSLKEELQDLYPLYPVGDISLANVIYATSNVKIRMGDSTDYRQIGLLNKYESALVLGEYGDWYLTMNRDNLIGFVNKNYTKKIDTTFVVIDLSLQHLWLYDEDSVLLETDIVTGSPNTPTNIGLFKIYQKQENRYLKGEDYNVHVNYWLPFNGGIGLHDASWRRKFGGSIYLNDGSHGCVNMPSDKASELYENVLVGTKVLVHK